MKLTPRKHYQVGQFATITEDVDGDFKVEIKGRDYACEGGVDEAVKMVDAMWRDLGEALGYEIDEG